jgi:hypothetical protein
MGVQQSFGGLARVVGPVWSTAAFQGLGVQIPFYLASGIVLFVVLLTSRTRRAAVAEATGAA